MALPRATGRARGGMSAVSRRGAAPQRRRGQASRCLAFLAVACGAAAVLGPVPGATFVGGGGFARLAGRSSGDTARTLWRVSRAASDVKEPQAKESALGKFNDQVSKRLGHPISEKVLYTYFMRKSAGKENYTQEEIVDYNAEKWVANLKIVGLKGKPEVTGNAAPTQKEAMIAAAKAALTNTAIQAALANTSDTVAKKGTKGTTKAASTGIQTPTSALHNQISIKMGSNAPLSERVTYTFIKQENTSLKEQWVAKVDLIGLEEKPSLTGPGSPSKVEAKTAAAAAVLKDPKIQAMLGLPADGKTATTNAKKRQRPESSLPPINMEELEIGQSLPGVANAVGRSKSGLHVDIGVGGDAWLGFEEMQDAGFPFRAPKYGTKLTNLRVLAKLNNKTFLTQRSGELTRPESDIVFTSTLRLPDNVEDVASEFQALGNDTWMTAEVVRFITDGPRSLAQVKVELPSDSSKDAWGVVFQQDFSEDFKTNAVIGGNVKVRVMRVDGRKPAKLSMRERGSSKPNVSQKAAAPAPASPASKEEKQEEEAPAPAPAPEPPAAEEAKKEETVTTTPPPPADKKSGGLLDILLR